MLPGMIRAGVLLASGPLGRYVRVAALGLPGVPAVGQSILAGDGASYRVVDVVWELTGDNDGLHTLTVYVEKS